ncbi:hypothetical protein CBS101457_004764 [Exobasidium rhododendri]|nr:hypothetical protein CBS101457_004764 [Exobasidium rhododendri]
MKSYGRDELDYCALVRELSRSPNIPTSAHLRNHLIAAYAAQSRPIDISKQDQWKIYGDYRKGVQLIAIGDVPSAIIKGITGEAYDSEDLKGIWGIAVVFPTYAPGWIEQSKDAMKNAGIWDGMRLSIWLSSESSKNDVVSMDSIRAADVEEEKVLDFIFHDFVSQAAQRLTEFNREKDEMGSDDDQYVVNLFAINEMWVTVLRRWTHKGDKYVTLTRANPCMTFIKPEEEAFEACDYAPRWQVSSIESKEDIVLVQSSNSLAFPLWYIENRRHISILVRDGQEEEESSRSEYPTHIQAGSPAAWAYAHDDLSLASLHVAEPYRRLGLGRVCVAYMAKKLIDAQKGSLLQAGCGYADVQTPFILDTEMHKGASRLFFEELGFKGVVIATWGSILVTKEREA